LKTIIVYINSMNAAGGIERVISNLLQNWAVKYNIILLVKDEPYTSFYPIPENVKQESLNEVLKLNMNNRLQRIIAVLFNTIRTHSKLKHYLKLTPYDYIYTTTPMNSLEVLLAGAKSKERLVISEHASAFAVNKVYRMVKRLVYPKAKCISVPNLMDCKLYESWGCKTYYIPHLFTFHNEWRNDLDSKIALNIGRLTADKQQSLLIRMWAAVRERYDWKLWIVGSGEEKIHLEQEIKKYKLEDDILLLDHRKDIDKIYKQASLFLFSSKMEGFGMVLLEAMSFGIPCISFDCPSGPRDIVKNGYNGFLIEPGDEKQFVRYIQKYFDMNEISRDQMGKNAFDTVQRWDNNKILECWYSIFDEQ